MLADLDVVEPLIAQGLIAPKFQYRNRRDGLIAQFDFGDIADQTRHPFRLQCEQSKLTRIIHDRLRGDPNFEIVFSSPSAPSRRTAIASQSASNATAETKRTAIAG